MVSSRASIKTLKQQQGLVLLVFVIIMVLAFTSYTFSTISLSKVKDDRDKQTLSNLKKAKQALINYAVTYSDRGVDNDYGILPYPETDFFKDDDGNTETVVAGSTKNTNVIGWLPWRELDIANIKDDSGACLFYAVSGTYKLGASVQADMINDDSMGMFRVFNNAGNVVQGDTIDEQVVALVIAPGEPLVGQARAPTDDLSSCGRDYDNVVAYLEGNGVYDNSSVSVVIDTVDDFIHATKNSSTEATPYNDKFLTITRDEIWKSIVERPDFKNDMESLTQGLATCVANYANSTGNKGRRLPWPAKVNLGSISSYRDDGSYVDDGGVEGYSGRYPFVINNTNAEHEDIEIATTDFPENDLFEISGLCNDLGNDWQGNVINLEDDSSKYRHLWNNWKDHFFYIISKVYEPDNSGNEKVCTDAITSCITVEGTEYAAAVIFSGSRLSGATRNDKALLADYLEDSKDTTFATEQVNKTGDGSYSYTDPQTDTNNDIMYCIQDQVTGTPLDVIECI